MKILFIKIIMLNIALSSLLAHADSPHEPGTSFDAHVHGLSEMTIAIEGKALVIQLKSPAMNLIGFEHQARMKKDIAAVENAALLLGKHDTLFSFAGDRCTLVNTSIDVSGVLQNSHADHEHPMKADTHKNERVQKHNYMLHDNHSEIIANYNYACEGIGKLSSVTATLFEVFPGIYQIRAMWITETQQGAATLSAGNRTLSLR